MTVAGLFVFLYYLSLGCHLESDCKYQCNWLPGKTCLCYV